MTEDIILVDKEDQQIGTGEKMEVHRKGMLHRAFSVFVWNKEGHLMVQQRAKTKYHTPGLWSNTCCSHPKPGETVEQAAKRRLEEEMGFSCDLNEEMSIIYHTQFDNDLIEHEYDHVLFGHYDGTPVINPEEVHSWKWMSINDIHREVRLHPELYTVWFRIIIDRLKNENVI